MEASVWQNETDLSWLPLVFQGLVLQCSSQILKHNKKQIRLVVSGVLELEIHNREL